MQSSTRPVDSLIDATPTSDGAGVRLYRSLGGLALPQHDPFLLLDEFRSDRADDYIAGFPDHPHRGFETVTYMLAGRMEHRDSKGRQGLLQAGGLQWMTAGRGIIHSEMPRQQDGLLWGFQLWVNLPARLKLMEPRYQDIEPEHVPRLEPEPGLVVRVLAGEQLGTRGPVEGIASEPLLLDLALEPGKQLRVATPEDHSVLLYVFEGGASCGQPGTQVRQRQLAVLGAGSQVQLDSGDQPARALLLAARPFGEPIARYGPFVMNTRQELQQAFDDYAAGRLAD